MTIHVVFAGDDGVARCMAVAMRSVWETATDTAALRFHVIHAMNSLSMKRIEASLPAEAHIEFIDASARINGLPHNNGRVVDASLGYWLRSFAADLLPDVNRAVYLDADTLCLSDIGELFAIDLAGAPIGAVTDAYQTFAGAQLPDDYDGDNAYFNSGVLLCDFEAWRNEDVSSQIVDLVTQQQPPFAHLDQDALNIIFANRWLDVSPDGEYWNDRRTSRLARQDAPEAEVNEQLATANVLHFTTPYKPWREEYPQSAAPFALWHDIASRTDFAAENLEPFNAIGWHGGRWQPTAADEVLLIDLRDKAKASTS